MTSDQFLGVVVAVVFAGLASACISHCITDAAWRHACRRNDVMRYNESTGILEWRVQAEEQP